MLVAALPAAHAAPGPHVCSQPGRGRGGRSGHMDGRGPGHRTVRGALVVQDLALPDPRQPGTLGRLPRSSVTRRSRHTTPWTRSDSTPTGSGRTGRPLDRESEDRLEAATWGRSSGPASRTSPAPAPGGRAPRHRRPLQGRGVRPSRHQCRQPADPLHRGRSRLREILEAQIAKA